MYAQVAERTDYGQYLCGLFAALVFLRTKACPGTDTFSFVVAVQRQLWKKKVEKTARLRKGPASVELVLRTKELRNNDYVQVVYRAEEL